MSFALRKSTAGQVVQFKMVDSTTGLKKTGLTIANTDIKLIFEAGTTQTSKNSGGATEIGSTGVYYMTLDATDSATLGRLRIDIEVAGALPWFANLMVLTALAWDALYASSGGAIMADVQTIKTQTVTCAAGVTVGAFVGNATAALSVNASGRVDLGLWLGSAPLALSSQQVQAVVPTTQKVDVETIKTNPVVNAGTVTFPTGATLASTTNITAGTLTTVTTATNLTNAPTVGDFTSTMKTSIGTAVAASAVASVTAGVTVSTNNDKTGYSLTVTPPTAATIATAVWTDTTAGDFTTTSSPGKILVAQLGGAFTTTSSSVFTVGALANAPTGGSAPTAAQIATAVWQDTTSGDFTVSSSIGKSLYTSGNAPGAASGLALVGSAMTLSSAYDFAKGTVAMTEAYAANGIAPTPVQAIFAIHQYLQDFVISGTSYTVKQLNNSTTAFIVTLNDAVTPTSASRT